MQDTQTPSSPSEDLAITASESRFRTLFEQAPFSVQLLAADGRTLQVNKAWETLWQISDGDGLKDYVLTEYNMLTDPQLQAKGVTACLLRAFAGESVSLPAILYDPTELGRPGHSRWVSAQAHPIRDQTGQVHELMLIHEDVTQRMQSEQMLRDSEMRLKQLANTIPQLAWMADPTGYIHWYNERWYDYTGTTPQDMEGWGWQSVHHPERLPGVIERWKASLGTGRPFQMTFPLRGKDGVFRPFFTLVAPLKDESGKVVQWFGTNTDVSPLEAAEEELRKTEERLRLATDVGNIGIWEWTIAEDRVTWSDRVYQLHGLKPDEFGGQVQDFLPLIHPDDRAGLWQAIEVAIQKQTSFSAEFRALQPDGSSQWLSTWARVHSDTNGKPDRIVGATISIDAHKKVEAALKESDRRKDEFLAMLAHELRNPLAPVSTAAQLLKIAAHDEKRVKQASEIISRQVTHMTELVDDLLDVSRVTRGLVQLEKARLDLKSVISSAIEQVRPLIEARHHVLTTWMDAERVYVDGDSTRLIQVMVNLLNNAAKYTGQGGEIALKVEMQGANVKISIRDNGLGIDASLLPHVFELFTQATRTPDRSQGGLGIGLALVERIVSLHDGKVKAFSDGPGKGSIFVFTLPVADGGPQVPSLTSASAQHSVKRPVRVMVVDDNIDAAYSLAALLEIIGHHVDVCENAAGALEVAERNPPEVFILDIGLPDMDGYDLAKSLRARPSSAHALFIALTGYGQAHDRVLSKAAGFDHHFVKPVDTQNIVQILSGLGRS